MMVSTYQMPARLSFERQGWRRDLLLGCFLRYNLIGRPMSKLLLRWIVLAISVVVAAFVVRALGLGFEVDLDSPGSIILFMLGVAVLAFLNATLGTLLKLLTLPLNCMTLGLFSLVINALVLWVAASFELGYRITGTAWQQFLAALLGSIVIAFVSGILGMMLPDDK
jgi:putative membrane protein